MQTLVVVIVAVLVLAMIMASVVWTAVVSLPNMLTKLWIIQYV